MFLSLGLLLLSARLFGELAKRFHQPAVLGELIAGILLGPTVLGHLAPATSQFIFPHSGPEAVVFKGITSLAVVLFLLVVGMEVNLAAIRRQSRTGLAVSAGGMLIPFGLGFLVAWNWPALLGMSGGANPLIFALFIATAMAISALPVIAKTLMDINLFGTDLGMVVISAAIVNDFAGWIIFAIIIGMMGASAPGGSEHHSAAEVVLLALSFAVAMLTIGRWLLHRVLPWIQAHLSWPGGVLSFTLALSLFGAALSEWIGLHAIFGSFLVGVAIGDSHHLRERTRAVIEQFISFFFAPLFFASIGLGVDFIANFDPVMVAVLLSLACAGKVLGCTLGARLSGMGARESWAVGWGMNSRGAMEILLGTIALRVELINARTFVGLVVIALATSMMAGPMMQRVLRRKRVTRLVDHLTAKGFILELTGSTPEEVIRELAAVVAPPAGLEVGPVAAAVVERERSMSTAFGKHLAIPHARLPGLPSPLVGIGLKAGGLAFGAPDGEPVHLVVMLLTSTEDNGDQIALLADVAATFKGDEASAQLATVRSFTEFLALVKSLQGGVADQARAERDRRIAISADAGARAGSGRDSG
jgi:Kef-type K+ transport system membrane component KefB/mannitol/fructose-specific phosphotransferase system IIA component (Ntr-type)